MPETELITEILQPNAPELAHVVSVRDVAHRWKAEKEYVRRRLREDGVHLIRIEHPLMARLRDLQEFEEAHTIILGSKSEEKAKQKEVVATSR